MPRYKCHKVVHALKIKRIDYPTGRDMFGLKLVIDDAGYEPIYIRYPEAARFKQMIEPESDDPGYLVVYKGGYRAWSPTKEFEAGYALI